MTSRRDIEPPANSGIAGFHHGDADAQMSSITLKLSRSMKRAATCVSRRFAVRTARSMRLSSSARFGRFVRESWKAWRASICCDRFAQTDVRASAPARHPQAQELRGESPRRHRPGRYDGRAARARHRADKQPPSNVETHSTVCPTSSEPGPEAGEACDSAERSRASRRRPSGLRQHACVALAIDKSMRSVISLPVHRILRLSDTIWS